MAKQKICIIGDGLTAMVTALVAYQQGVQVDIIDVNKKKGKATKIRTIALSNSNFLFLKKRNLISQISKFFWKSSQMELYSLDKKNKVEKFFSFEKNDTNSIFYLILNHILNKKLNNKIKKFKIKKIKYNLSNLNENLFKKKYNLIINCTGSNSAYTHNIFGKNNLRFSYNEKAATLVAKHKPIKNNIARQIFLSEGPLALLPISNTLTSLVWSIKKVFINKSLSSDKLIKNKIKNHVKFFFKIKSLSKIEYNDLNFHLAKKYYYKRILNIGETLHQVHPFAGQGFNMILRDVQILEKILCNRLSLGLDIGDESVFIEFTKKRKKQNFVFASSINYLNKLFNLSNTTSSKEIRNFFLKKINNNFVLKDKLFNYADKGFNF